MSTYVLGLPATEVVRLLRAENESALGQPELNTSARKEYVIEEEFDSRAYGIQEGRDFDLVTSITTLSIEPRVESGYWVLEAVVERPLGPVRTSKEGEFAFKESSLDEFEEELQRPGRKRILTRLQVQTPAVRQDFGRWLEQMQARHPRQVPILPAEGGVTPEAPQTTLAPLSKSTEPVSAATRKYWVREAVGVFSDADALEAAVDELEESGFDRAVFSVLATDAKAREQLEGFYRTVKETEDSGEIFRAAFVSSDSRAEGEAAMLGVPLYIGGVAGIWAAAALGGSLALTIAGAIALGTIGASLGAVLADAVEHDHSAQIQEQLKLGGMVLWVALRNSESEKLALAVLCKTGARDIHVHEIQREWSLKEIPFAETQPDPFLESDKSL